MNSRVLLVIFLLLALNVQVFARGRGESEEIKTQNDEWILCITSFDVSSLPPEKLYLADVIKRKMVERLTSISYRTRISPEYAYYEEFAWSNARSTAARAIATKQDERSALIFRGDPDWRYRQNLARIDADLERLHAALEEVDNNAPLINREPVFGLTRGNLDFSFPAAPSQGTEYRFCTTQRSDAFLTGSIMTFHGRYMLSVNLYTVYTRSFVWEDRIVFSLEDLDQALDEFIRRLLIVLSGNQPASIAVIAEPEETLVLINRSFAGRGNTDVLEFPPGTVTVTATAPNHESITFETVLSPDELTVINLSLNPVRFTDVRVSADSQGRVYHGALYIGDAPLTLRLPLNHLEYIEIETTDAKRGAIVFQTPQTQDMPQSIFLRSGIPLPKGRVERERNAFYWGWGATWITGIAAWISWYSYSEADKAIRLSYSQNNEINVDFHNSYMNMFYVHRVSLIAAGVAATYSIYRFIRYLYNANRGSVSVSTGRN